MRNSDEKPEKIFTVGSSSSRSSEANSVVTIQRKVLRGGSGVWKIVVSVQVEWSRKVSWRISVVLQV